MATFAAIFIPDSSQDLSATITTASSSAEIVLYKGAKFAINATGDLNIRFGIAGMAAASAANFRLPGGSTSVYDAGDHADRIRLFNPGGSTATYWIQVLYND